MATFTVDSSPSNMHWFVPRKRYGNTLHSQKVKFRVTSRASQTLNDHLIFLLPFFTLSTPYNPSKCLGRAMIHRLLVLNYVGSRSPRNLPRDPSKNEREESKNACNNVIRDVRANTRRKHQLREFPLLRASGSDDSFPFFFLLLLYTRSRTEKYRFLRAIRRRSTIRENETIRNVPRRVSGNRACYFLENGPSTGYIGNWTIQRSLIPFQDRRDTIVHVRGMENEIVCCTLFRLLLRFSQPPKNLCMCVCVILYRARMDHSRTAPRILLFPTKIEMSLGTF